MGSGITGSWNHCFAGIMLPISLSYNIKRSQSVGTITGLGPGDPGSAAKQTSLVSHILTDLHRGPIVVVRSGNLVVLLLLEDLVDRLGRLLSLLVDLFLAMVDDILNRMLARKGLSQSFSRRVCR